MPLKVSVTLVAVGAVGAVLIVVPFEQPAEVQTEVRVGQRVAVGQVVGRIGNSGNSSEPHLHFQLMNHPRMAQGLSLPAPFARVLVNGVPGGVAWAPDGSPFAVLALTVRGGRIVRIDVLADPDDMPAIREITGTCFRDQCAALAHPLGQARGLIGLRCRVGGPPLCLALGCAHALCFLPLCAGLALLVSGQSELKVPVLGALMIGLINNGLILMGLESSQQQIVRGAIIILAVALARRARRESRAP